MTLPPTAGLLHSLGWDDGWEAAFEVHRAAGLTPARVAVQHRGAYDLIGDGGEVRTSAVVRLAREGGLPAVGDWVAVDPETGLIDAVLPRRTAVSRKEVWHAVKEQVLAANVDIVFLTQGAAARLQPAPARAVPRDGVGERGAADGAADEDRSGRRRRPVPRRGRRWRRSGRVPSTRSRPARAWVSTRCARSSARTAPPSCSARPGVGKSTIVNAFAGNDDIATQEVRESDQRGRHTTTRRELVLLPGGGVILDTPGMRELQLWDADLKQTFGDVEEIAARCRFTDCSHDQRARLRGSRGARRRNARGRSLGELRQAGARTGGARAAPRRTGPQGTAAAVQDSTNGRCDATSADRAAGSRPRGAVLRGSTKAGASQTVSLAQEVARPRLGPPFAFDGESWQLRFPRPAADRLEYLLEIDGALGPDPANPRRAPGPFGDKSVVEWPEYTPPRWLDSPATRGTDRAGRAPLPPARRLGRRPGLLDAGGARRRCAAPRRARRPGVRASTRG